MKTWMVVLGWLSLSFGCLAADHCVSLIWNPNSESDVTGYHLYSGVTSRTYTNVINVGPHTTITVCNLVPSTRYYFAVTAYNRSGGESDFSREYIFDQPADPPPYVQSIAVSPQGVRITWTSFSGAVYHVTWANDPAGVWTEINSDIVATGTLTSILLSAPNGQVKFYRIKRIR